MRRLFLLLSLFLCITPLWASDWMPTITGIDTDGNDVKVSFTLSTSAETADKAEVELYDAQGNLLSTQKVGRSRKDAKKAYFTLDASGTYFTRVKAVKGEESQYSPSVSFPFTLVLQAPTVTVRNLGGGTLLVQWDPVKEADGYTVTAVRGGMFATVSRTTDTSVTLKGLSVGTKYAITVRATRGNGQAESQTITKTAREEAERIWTFTEFGQSTKPTLNTFTLLDGDDLSFQLASCTFSKDGAIIEKGGKFTAFHDGVSFLYTTLDPKTENFTLTATFHIDYINPVADGQEGFGLMAMDRLGEAGVSSVNHYTNSAAIIATKFEETIGGVKKTSKDTLGARFVTGLTDEIINGGDQAIAQYGTSESHAFSYDQSDLVRTGDVYRLTLKKDNTGYHAIFKRTIASEDTIEEYILYEPDALSVLDPDHLYVGFVVARGCNVTVNDVQFTTTNKADDPPGIPKPLDLIPITTKVDSPTTYSDAAYPFAYVANCDGYLTVKRHNGPVLLDKERVTADTTFTKILTLEKGINDYEITFQPKEGWAPYPGSTMASYDKEAKRYVASSQAVSTSLSVIYLSYPGTTLYASNNGSPFGDGSRSDPLDISSAVAFCAPSQTIVLTDPEYHLTRPLLIQRGNDGKPGKPKTLKAESRSVLDFSMAGGGMQLWGSYWVIQNIDITNTPDNVKGLQIAGNDNLVQGVYAYRCGDTGIQISGSSTEPYEKWPARNRVVGCISHDNCDSAQNNADGFAAKLTVGDGNLFSDCIAYHNIDDGWDLYAKIETGPIGAVTIQRCVAYGNGSLSDGSGNGDGNGFKLGGDGIAVPHLLSDSIAYANGASGITSNSNPAVRLKEVTSYGNAASNIALYGKGSGARSFSVTGVLSFAGGQADTITEYDGKDATNFFWDGAVSSNGETKREKSIFTSTDMTITPTVTDAWTIDTHGLFSQSSGSGANL
jgi:hypothetical protein